MARTPFCFQVLLGEGFGEIGVAPNAWTLGLGGHRYNMTQLEFVRAQVAESRVSPLPVVEQLDVFEERAAGLLARAPLSLVDQLDFERGKEAFRHRIVPAVSTAAHAAQDSVRRQQL